ncbi:muraminidase-like protein [Dinothrombium tinctorium]|uniref:Muraminidase-like protein n=1 Tax=Dinothrombium tinctorium TaxID=1965070 RepID=A0A3S3SML5_9ACAR|nr:muraminidase-like protein [Dinothrombium tinctorium]RWS17295.1 muraminidase-like protein [Dinothrombium tinctorium]RWS17315.1 muraminidase-like protein [Dinothrombium tinctorium]
MSWQAISLNGIELIKAFETCKLQACLDTRGRWSIGYGHHGPDVTEETVIDEQLADELLEDDLLEAEQAVNELVHVMLTQEQFDALVSFTLDVGVENLKESALLKRLNQCDEKGVLIEFLRWVYCNDSVVSDLVARRKAERDLFASCRMLCTPKDIGTHELSEGVKISHYFAASNTASMVGIGIKF